MAVHETRTGIQRETVLLIVSSSLKPDFLDAKLFRSLSIGDLPSSTQILGIQTHQFGNYEVAVHWKYSRCLIIRNVVLENVSERREKIR